MELVPKVVLVGQKKTLIVITYRPTSTSTPLSICSLRHVIEPQEPVNCFDKDGSSS